MPKLNFTESSFFATLISNLEHNYLDLWLDFLAALELNMFHKIYILYKILFINHFHKLKPVYLFFSLFTLFFTSNSLPRVFFKMRIKSLCSQASNLYDRFFTWTFLSTVDLCVTFFTDARWLISFLNESVELMIQ